MVGHTYDLVIIGGGSAGLTAAGFAVQLGRKVALVENHRIGGDCTWTGCVPSKALLKVAQVAHQMRNAARYGLGPAEPAVDLKAVMAHVRSAVDEVYRSESPETLRADGIEVFLGQARFRDANTLEAGDGDVRLDARRFLIVTGARPFIPPVPGLDEVGYLTYETIWDLEELPEHLIVVGGGPVGCELAQAFCRLGARVTLLEAAPRILLQDDPEAADLVAQRLTEDGVDLRLGSAVQQVWRSSDGIHVGLDEAEVVGDALLLSVGRQPNVSALELEKAGVAYTAKGIQVDRYLHTTQQHIYAAGDCVGGYQFTHYAAWQGFMAVRNAFLPGATRGVLDRVPWATFTDPEVAHVGLTEGQAREKFGEGVMVCRWPMDRVDRAIAEGNTSGFVKLVHRSNGTVLGATIVAARAGEMIHEWSLAIDRGLKLGDLANSIHIYPTYSTSNMQAAAHIRVEQLLAGTYGRVVRGLARLAR
jgi:pyruvate/2-oxoglutarate dehydrogenase complex dihydrolipoamide dehydrogenase (E3) component